MLKDRKETPPTAPGVLPGTPAEARDEGASSDGRRPATGQAGTNRGPGRR